MSRDPWEQIKGWLATKTWGRCVSKIGSLKPNSRRFSDGELTVRVPNETTEAWIRQEYTSHIRTAVEELQLPVRRVHYEIASLVSRRGCERLSKTAAFVTRTPAASGRPTWLLRAPLLG